MSLTVEIKSFSYKNELPKDTSGNGGGFVFDLRGIFNPGRFENFKSLTGLHQDVIDFLDDLPEMQTYLDHVNALLTLTIENYLERNFEHLQVNFGCTGGQHRSVYATEKTANYLSNLFPNIEIKREHTNQNNWKTSSDR